MIFAIFLAVSIAAGLLLGVITGIAGLENMSVGNFIAYNLSMLFILWFAWNNSRKLEEKVFHFNAIPPSLYPLLVILTLSFSVILDLLSNLLPMPEIMEKVFAMLATRDVWTFLMVGITGPILEEVLFRGIILDGFLRRYSPLKAVFWSAFLFGLFHLNPWQFIPGFLTGLLMGYVYLKTRSLIPVILMHMVNNSLSWLIMYFYGSDVYSFAVLFELSRDYAMFVAAATLLSALCLLILYSILKKNKISWTLN